LNTGVSPVLNLDNGAQVTCPRAIATLLSSFHFLELSSFRLFS
jgi:hypothetical protein